jgi:hypothetical protein
MAFSENRLAFFGIMRAARTSGASASWQQAESNTVPGNGPARGFNVPHRPENESARRREQQESLSFTEVSPGYARPNSRVVP